MTPCLPAAPLSVLLVLMDDMRADQLSVLTETLSRVSDHAQVYERAYVTTPMCCPDRASLLSGGYAAPQHGVLSNSGATAAPTALTTGAAWPRACKSWATTRPCSANT